VWIPDSRDLCGGDGDSLLAPFAASTGAPDAGGAILVAVVRGFAD
jgi:hypothetical protein